IKLAKLDKGDSSLHVAHTIIITKYIELGQFIGLSRLMTLFFGNASSVIPQGVNHIGELGIAGCHNPALPAGDRVARGRRKVADSPKTTCRPADICRSGRTSGVFNNWNLLGNRLA